LAAILVQNLRLQSYKQIRGFSPRQKTLSCLKYGKKKVCELHFQEDDIIKTIETTLPTGEKVVIPLKIWKLTPTAVPSIFPS
jgi:hypothetical protein